jgi:hypothetical protein
MAKDKKTILVYADWISIFEKLEDDEAGKLIKHFFRYVNDQNPSAPDRLTDIIFEPIKQQLKRDLKKYEANCLKNRDNAFMRWDAVACERMRTDAKHADTDTDTDKDTDKDIINIDFSIFWDLYAKKIDRIKCEKKWKALTSQEREDCIYNLPAYLQVTPDVQFRRNPETYLNNKSWQNEIIKHGNNKKDNGATTEQIATIIASKFASDRVQ